MQCKLILHGQGQDYVLHERPQFMQKWEYKHIHFDIHQVSVDELNKLGQDGWEVVASGEPGTEQNYGYLHLILKRQC